MDETIYKIALAGLLHDVGKFAQRAEGALSDDTRQMENIICKLNQGNYSHKHVLWTNEFFDIFPGHPFLLIGQGDDSVVNLASYHHAPSTKLQEIIQLADCLSSGSDRNDDAEVPSNRNSYKKERMRSIFDYMSLGYKRNEEHIFRYELDPLDDDVENCFPTRLDNLTPKEGEKLVSWYADLWNAFCAELRGIQAPNTDAFLISVMSLLEKYTWSIPSSTINRPDISLYDHAKTTAAIAVALYSFHDALGNLAGTKFNTRDTTLKFRLMAGDLSGIQSYIFNIKNVGVGGTAKRLRARSFFLSAIAEIASHKLLHGFGLPLTNLIMTSGGKFYLLLPNSDDAEDKIRAFEKEISGWCLQELNGEISLNCASVPFSCHDFFNFSLVLKNVNDALQKAKNRAFSVSLSDKSGWKSDDFVLARQFGEDEKLCDSCEKFPGTKRQDENTILCRHCFDDVQLGTELSRAVGVQFFKGRQGSYKVFEGYSFSIAKRKEQFSSDAYLVNQFNNWDFKHAKVALRPRYFANYIPVFDQDVCRYCKKGECGEQANAMKDNPKFFTCLAEAGRGRNALGVFKADVDNLGLIFINGFQTEKDKAISRITTLSRMLDTFFTGRIDYLLRSEFKDMYTVYAGGDDLLLLGPWEQTLRFSIRVRKEFADFTCGNPAFTLSAGVAVVKPRLPVYAAIDYAEELLKQAKANSKNQLAALEDLVTWDSVDAVMKDADKLAEWQESKKVSMGFVRQLLESAEQFRLFSKTGETRHLRFVPMLAYSIARNIPAKETEIINWTQDLTDLASKRLKNLTFIANYSIQTNRS